MKKMKIYLLIRNQKEIYFQVIFYYQKHIILMILNQEL